MDEKHSQEFIENISKLIKESKKLNHNNFSGMNLSEDYLRIIFNCLSKSRLIMGIHLNDNGITNN